MTKIPRNTAGFRNRLIPYQVVDVRSILDNPPHCFGFLRPWLASTTLWVAFRVAILARGVIG